VALPRTVRPTRALLRSRAVATGRLRRSGPLLLVAVGDVMLDIVVAPSRPIERGTDVPGTVTFRRGGSAANVCAAFVRAGGRARLVTSVGTDRWVTSLLAAVRSEGVLLGVTRHDGASGRLAVLLEPDGERSFITERGAADALRPSDLRATWFTGADCLHVPAYSLLARPIADAVAHATALARSVTALVSLDLSSRGPLLELGAAAASERLAGLGADVLFANRDEAAAVLGRRTTAALPGLLDLSPLAVVKDGRAGARVLWRDPESGGIRQLEVAAERLRVTDSTGAGDAFAAGFLHVLVAGSGRSRAGEGRGWDATLLRRAALGGHRAAGKALARRPAVLELA
jgi:sugar/nucleoside kinase (ribokinase family)